MMSSPRNLMVSDERGKQPTSGQNQGLNALVALGQRRCPQLNTPIVGLFEELRPPPSIRINNWQLLISSDTSIGNDQGYSEP